MDANDRGARVSASRSKGTGYENYVLERYLKFIWPQAERTAQKGIKDFGDFLNVGNYLVEAKKWDKWDLPQWIRTIQKKIATRPTSPWLLFFAGDKRKGLGDLVVMPADQYIEQLRTLQRLTERERRKRNEDG